jgi:hypothetical protein
MYLPSGPKLENSAGHRYNPCCSSPLENMDNDSEFEEGRIHPAEPKLREIRDRLSEILTPIRETILDGGSESQ